MHSLVNSRAKHVGAMSAEIIDIGPADEYYKYYRKNEETVVTQHGAFSF